MASLARVIRGANSEGKELFAASVFTDYWNGLGFWNALNRKKRESLTQWIPNADYQFPALLNSDHLIDMLHKISCPITLCAGRRSNKPALRIVELLKEYVDVRDVCYFDTANHMGPVTHPELMASAIENHISQLKGEKPQ